MNTHHRCLCVHGVGSNRNCPVPHTAVRDSSGRVIGHTLGRDTIPVDDEAPRQSPQYGDVSHADAKRTYGH